MTRTWIAPGRAINDERGSGSLVVRYLDRQDKSGTVTFKMGTRPVAVRYDVSNEDIWKAIQNALRNGYREVSNFDGVR